MKRQNVCALTLFVVFYLGYGLYLTIAQESFIYLPSGQPFGVCPALAEATPVVTNDTRFYVTDTDRPVVVLYHGNAGSACDRAFYASIIKNAGYDIAIVEYTGFGGDTKSPTHAGIKADVRNVIAYFEASTTTIKAVIGESIGTGPASYHVSLAPPEKLLLLTPFTDLKALIGTHVWFYPTALLVKNDFSPLEKLSSYRGHVTIIHGDRDSVVPLSLATTLYQSLSTNKHLMVVKTADHNNLFLFRETIEGISGFLASGRNDNVFQHQNKWSEDN